MSHLLSEAELFHILKALDVRGLRFQPTELELIEYLEEHMRGDPVSPNRIPVVDLNLVEPREIPLRCQALFPGEKHEWYLIHSCLKKYPTSSREDRSTPEGFWKATGRPTKVLDRQGNQVGTRKTLVFYSGRASNRGSNEGKTDWIMHEFRSESAQLSPTASNTWVICSISNKPLAATGPSPGPASPSSLNSGGRSERSYSPGSPSGRSGDGSGDLSAYFPQIDARTVLFGGSSPIQHLLAPLDVPPQSGVWSSGETYPTPDSARSLKRCTAFTDRDGGSGSIRREFNPGSPTGSSSSNMQNVGGFNTIPSLDRWRADSITTCMMQPPTTGDLDMPQFEGNTLDICPLTAARISDYSQPNTHFMPFEMDVGYSEPVDYSAPESSMWQ